MKVNMIVPFRNRDVPGEGPSYRMAVIPEMDFRRCSMISPSWWPGLSRPTRLLGSVPSSRGRRDKLGEDALATKIPGQKFGQIIGQKPRRVERILALRQECR
jgi:hypothetical protein